MVMACLKNQRSCPNVYGKPFFQMVIILEDAISTILEQQKIEPNKM